MGDSTKLWSDGPQICNVDPKVMPYYSFHARCNYCEESIPFTTELERDMRKHYNLKHRLYCNACKRSDFCTREDLNAHLSTFHKDGVCFNCQASFKLASALAMHVEGPRNDCAVPHAALVRALQNVFQSTHNADVRTDNVDPNAVYSPVSCCPGGEPTVQKLKDFRKTLLLAHEKAFCEVKLENCGSDLVAPLTGDAGVEHVSESLNLSPPPMGAAAGCELSGNDVSPAQVKRMVSGEVVSHRDDIRELFPREWACSTCVDAKFTTLSKLLQHVEQKVRNSWWMSLHN